MPDAWHVDCGFEHATWPVRSVKLCAFFGEVGPRGGGTMLLPGTHRLVGRYRESFLAPAGARKENWRPFSRSRVITRGWLACSTAPTCQAMTGRWSGAPGEIGDIMSEIAAYGTTVTVEPASETRPAGMS